MYDILLYIGSGAILMAVWIDAKNRKINLQ